jgi:glycosyltransferase AglD
MRAQSPTQLVVDQDHPASRVAGGTGLGPGLTVMADAPYPLPNPGKLGTAVACDTTIGPPAVRLSGYMHIGGSPHRVPEEEMDPTGGSCGVLVTIPVRNEAPRLAAALIALEREFEASRLPYQLAIAEDGSTDGTKDRLRELKQIRPDLVVQSEEEAMGRGRAIRQLWTNHRAEVYCFIDADLAVGPDVLVRAVTRATSGKTIVTGSRYVRGSTTSRPPLRSMVSRIYNWATRLIFHDTIQDHQCGLKVFPAEVIGQLLPYSKEDSWFWDTEILVLATRFGYKVEELPVAWIERKHSRTTMRRLLSDIYLHGTGLIRLKSRVEELAPEVRGRPRWSGPQYRVDPEPIRVDLAKE